MAREAETLASRKSQVDAIVVVPVLRRGSGGVDGRLSIVKLTLSARPPQSPLYSVKMEIRI